MGSFNMATAESEIGLGKFYEQLRYPEFAKSPGSRRMRKLLGVAGWAKHALIYEFTSNEERAGSPVYQSIRKNMAQTGTHPVQWGEKVIGQTIHAPGSPVIGFRKWPKV